MPGQSNAGLDFHPVKCFRSDYTDLNGNQWLVEVAGELGVEEFVEARPVNCWVTPLTRGQAEEILAWMEGKRAQGGKPIEPEQDLQKDQAVEPEQILPMVEPPALAVTCTLVALARDAQEAEAYHVTFEIDPRMNAAQRPENYSFQLKGNDTTALVSFTSNGGKIRLAFPAVAAVRDEAQLVTPAA